MGLLPTPLHSTPPSHPYTHGTLSLIPLLLLSTALSCSFHGATTACAFLLRRALIGLDKGNLQAMSVFPGETDISPLLLNEADSHNYTGDETSLMLTCA